MTRVAWPLAVATAVLLLPACSEHSQGEPAALKKADAKASSGAAAADKAYMASGWTAGDDASWQTQIRGRNQGQNEYARITSATVAPPAAAPAKAP
ncbi:hypothetical protein [Ideonella sp.]|uniref:hypothetical protein n=1 Tax=Ideonella sp. TaxID=1929293 RepID=UPI0035B2D88B